MNMNERTQGFGASASQSVEVIDLMYYWHVLRRHLTKIIALSAVATVIAALVVMSITPIYKATTTLLIEAEEAKILSIEEVYGLNGQSSEYYQTQFEILKSRELAKRVVLELNLVETPEFNPFHPANKKSFSIKDYLFGEEEREPPTEAKVLTATVNNFWHAVSVIPLGKTQLVKISVQNRNPKLAQVAADAMANAYIQSQMEARVGMTQQAAVWLSERLGGLKERLEGSEHKLQEYREANGLIDVAGVDTLVSKQLDEITKRLVDASSKRLEAETIYQQVNSLTDRSYDSLSSLPVILSNPLVVTLRANETQAELKVSELSKRYGTKHPKMIAAQSDLDAVRDSMATQMKRIATGIEKEYMSAKVKEAALERALADKIKEVRNLNRTEFTLNEYTREVTANRTMYETFFNRIRETTETGDLQTANARISDPAVVPEVPIKPNKKLMVILTFVVSLMFGVGLALLLDALDATLKNAEDVERKLGMPLLGMLPMIEDSVLKKLGFEDGRLVRAFSDDALHGFSESVRTLRTSLTLAGLEHSAKVVLLTSSVPGEGKTTTSANLAEAYGQMEKTLLIDADMRRPTLAKKLGLPHNSKGLSNAVAYPDALDECIHHLEDLSIDVIPSGPIPPNPLELLSSRNFEQLLNTLRGRYDRIIIDTAPMRLVSDALYLSTLVDGVVYVVKADATKDKWVKGSLSKLDDSNARIFGVLLNQLDVNKEARYSGYGYYAGYYDAYGYTADDKPS
ncbi:MULTISPECIES: polysaccharide biosynthesis tyrosine autokinase [unclassified Oceanobacter]|uniref:GumC family protein n=1 Tax=unclassified Oceanobacter TaxID=2620260 RepID=UPI00273476E0|nr:MULTISPECIES: polysaccharide biosynthesis tyrosine autokinase [unclassified Oceanobacter]MDP2548176.1 polysaccharide biosynthesis tyrosine autokinase [Oceanobacter sp. 4_MG-2023]MDP2608097.1 polysaccharide biosynthesis tyrosine autokinase [Oceanobacter sp. 1_MG-2023]MDP2611241.1 polysaccharide biosynthesis tyrosine autokinase [Oceanobacter sp. 2_MG-2023]